MMMMTNTITMMIMACLNVVVNYLVGNDGDQDQDEDGHTTMVARVNVAERTALWEGGRKKGMAKLCFLEFHDLNHNYSEYESSFVIFPLRCPYTEISFYFYDGMIVCCASLPCR